MRYLHDIKRGMVILVLLAVTSIPSLVVAEQSFFSDIHKDHWAYQQIKDMADTGIIIGYPDQTFRPEELVTYGEFIKMATVAGAAVAHQDLKNANGSLSHWAKPFYQAGLNGGLFTRHDIDEAALDRVIPRGYMALIIGSLLEDGVLDQDDYSVTLDFIEDVDSRTPYEFEIIRSYLTGVLSGYPDRTFRPEKPLTRGEAAVAISRLVDQLKIQEEREDSLVVVGSVLTSEPLGTVTLTINNYDSKLLTKQVALLRELRAELSAPLHRYAEEALQAVLEFGFHEPGDSGQGIHKQYFGENPILMERIDETVRVFIFPEGYISRTWNTEPGEINEDFF